MSSWHPHGYDRHLQYRMACEEFDQLLARSGNRCEICRIGAADTRRGQLVIDHDHELGRWAVRGLLCGSCNVVLTTPSRAARGFVRRPELREAALRYLAGPFRGADQVGRFA